MISRRALFSLLGGKPERGFSLDAFYEKRAAPASFPRFTVRDGGVATETTRVGVPKRVVRIRESACLATRSFCTVCSERCPLPGAIVIELGRPRINDVACDGCGVCVELCPAPERAIEVIE